MKIDLKIVRKIWFAKIDSLKNISKQRSMYKVYINTKIDYTA